MKFLEVEKTENDPVKEQKTELVERKGIGHPDTISDGIAEAVSRKLSKYYKEEFGHILHHNTDEVQLVAGESKPSFGGGRIEKPIYILLAGRATEYFNGETIPVKNLPLKLLKITSTKTSDTFLANILILNHGLEEHQRT